MSAIHLKIRVGDQTLLRTFERLPIRIGRDPSNECQLDFPFISRVHARLDQCGDRLALFDEGSCNGTFVAGLLVRPGAPVVLEEQGSGFDLERIHVRVHVETHPQMHPDANATRGYEEGGVDPIALFRREPTGEDATAHAALRSLRQLAASLSADDLALDDPARVTAFVQRLDEVLRAFLDSFVALRFACRAETDAADAFDQRSSSAGDRFLDWTAADPRAATAALEEAALEIVRRHAQLSADARRAAHTLRVPRARGDRVRGGREAADGVRAEATME